MLVSVTRLQLRSLRYFPMFLWYAMASARQARRAPGFVGGWLGGESIKGNWTVTAWDSADAMRAFRNSGPHLKVMPKLLRWCDESAYTHWEQADAGVPSGAEAYERLAREGRLSKVLQPSASHAAGKRVGDKQPRGFQQLLPG